MNEIGQLIMLAVVVLFIGIMFVVKGTRNKKDK